MKNNIILRRSQLDRFFEQLKQVNLAKPKQGWVKEIRESLGMSMQDLGSRLGVIKQRVERIEKDELSKKVTLETMHKAAEAMDCRFVYFLVPNSSLDQAVKDQAQKVAEEMSKMVEKTMRLEDQGASEKGRKQGIEMIKNKLLSENYKKLWRKK